MAEKQGLFQKNERKSPFPGKKVLGYKKTGFTWEKKVIIKKGKKKDFFPPKFEKTNHYLKAWLYLEEVAKKYMYY